MAGDRVSTEVLTIPQVAQRLKCSKPTVYRLIAAGALRAVDISVPPATRSKTRVRVDDLQAYLEANTREAS